jgi:probable HAF family extracellular repeat protein
MPLNVFNTLDDPSASTGTTQAFGVNGMDQIVGTYRDASGTHSFLYSGGTYTTLDDPLATMGTFAFGINATGQVSGYYSSGNRHGFVYSGGTYTTLDDPLSIAETIAYGINASGQVVGIYGGPPSTDKTLAPQLFDNLGGLGEQRMR